MQTVLQAGFKLQRSEEEDGVNDEDRPCSFLANCASPHKKRELRPVGAIDLNRPRYLDGSVSDNQRNSQVVPVCHATGGWGQPPLPVTVVASSWFPSTFRSFASQLGNEETGCRHHALKSSRLHHLPGGVYEKYEHGKTHDRNECDNQFPPVAFAFIPSIRHRLVMRDIFMRRQ